MPRIASLLSNATSDSARRGLGLYLNRDVDIVMPVIVSFAILLSIIFVGCLVWACYNDCKVQDSMDNVTTELVVRAPESEVSTEISVD